MKTSKYLLTSIIILCIAIISLSLNSGQARAETTAVYEPDATFAQLLETAVQQGAVPIIIGLDVPGYDMTQIANGAQRAVDTQLAAINQAQQAVLDGLTAYSTSNVKQFKHIPFMALWVDEAALQAVAKLPGIVSIQPDELRNPETNNSIPLIRADNSHFLGYTGDGQVVAVLDTGVDRNHPDLSGRVVSESCFSTNNPIILSSSMCPNGNATQFGTGAAAPTSRTVAGFDHGTHVAGIVTAVAPDADIMAIQVFSKITDVAGSPVGILRPCASSGSSSPCTRTYTSDQISGLDRVFDLRNSYNIAAVNMSLGGGSYAANCDNQESALKFQIDLLRTIGITTVISAGNDGSRAAMSAPACISSAISVASSDSNDGVSTVDVVSSFSNISNLTTLIAPGRWIFSAVPTSATTCGFGVTPTNNRCAKGGTSMAAPHVAGTIAVLREASPNANVTTIRNALANTGPQISDQRSGGFVTKRRLDVYAAMCQLITCESDEFQVLTLNQTRNGSLSIGNGDHFDVYYFNGAANQRVRIHMFRTSGGIDPSLYVADPNNNMVAYNDNGGTGTNALIDLTILPVTGRYTIYALGGSGSGNYGINMTPGPAGSNPVPTINRLRRTSATVGTSSGFWVGMEGNNFVPNSVVRWNGINRPTFFSSSTLIWGWVYPNDMTTVGFNTMTVYNPTPGGGLSFGQLFRITDAPLGISQLIAPEPNASVQTGVQTTFAISWTHPISSWRVMENIDLRLKDENDQTAFWIRFSEGNPTSTISLLNVSGTQIVSGTLVSGQLGENRDLVITDTVTMHLGDTYFFGSGQTVVISPSLTFGAQAVGRYMVEFAVENDDGEIQDADVTGAFYILPEGCATAVTDISVSGPSTGSVNTDYVYTAATTPGSVGDVNYIWSPPPLSGQGTAVATYNWSSAGRHAVNVVADHCSGFLGALQDVAIGTTNTPDLLIGVTSPATAVAGAPITYTFSITNQGHIAATNLDVMATLPDGAAYVSGGTLMGDEVTWSLPALDGYATMTTTSVIVMANETITQTVYSVNASGGYGATGMETAVTRIVDAQVALTPLLTKTLVYDGGETAVVIPGGSVFVDTVLAYEELNAPGHTMPGGADYGGRAFSLSAYQDNRPAAITLGETATFTVAYSDEDVMGLDETLLALRYWDGTHWSGSGVSCTPAPANNQVTCAIMNPPMGEYALMTAIYEAYLPVMMNGVSATTSTSAQITGITLSGGQYAVTFVSNNFTPQLPGTHVHFFFNTVPPEEAGMPGAGPWYVYGGGSPFTGYGPADKPAAATQLCVLVANPNHSVQSGSGNCYDLP
ncbi:MAG: S8 family serine peptidase [Ardenticatenaceae bacterium]|nr:S8 family serine peptidase [Ardenticatenaceae bacterium]